jgi:thiol:disulfide interchange protein DsbD
MKFPRLLAWLGTALGLALVSMVQAATPSHVQASLVAAETSIHPGKPFTVALHFVHDPHWHTYWLNPGTGLATEIEWTLPAGWKAGPIQWPAPIPLKNRLNDIVGNGYEGDLLLPVTITPAADAKVGETVQLKAATTWLMCEEICVPGSADLTLSLPVSADPAQPDAQWGDKIRAVVAGLPRADSAWQVSAVCGEKEITLTVKSTQGGHTPEKPRFFADDNLVAYELPQPVKAEGANTWVITMPISPDGPKDSTKLLGVLTSDNGWMADGSLRGLRVEVPFAAVTPGVGGTATVTAPAGTGGHPATPSQAASSPASLPATLALAFIGGLILNLMPCVFPVLGIKILGFVNQSGHERGKVVAHGLTFAAGVLLSFWTLAGALALLRSGGSQLGWGFQLQSPVFVFALSALLLAFAMNMSGVYEFGLSATGIGSNLQSKSGLAGSFFTGVLATVVATPCSAPFLAPALGAALAVSTAESFAIFTTIAIGLSLPYLLLSIFPQAIKVLPRPGAWMETFKQLMAFPLYATVGYLLWVLAGQVSDEGLLNAFFGLTLVAMGVWAYGRYNAPGAKPGRARFGVAALIALAIAGAWLGWPKTAAAASSTAPGAVPEVVWEKWSPEAVAKLRGEGRIVYVDFTARWCATCQANKKLVFHSNDVLRAFADRKIVTLRADWTNQDPAITAELAKYNRSAVPFNVVWLPGKDAPVILPELLTPNVVLEAVKS